MTEQLLLSAPAVPTLTQAHSLALVQIFINASLACIAHARELIPWTSPCFRTRYVEQINTLIDADARTLYTAFKTLEGTATSGGQEIKILVRGVHKRADQVLEMLEDGIFEALEHRFLDAFQVFVTDADDSHDVLETYSFAFKYTQDRIHSVHMSSMSRVLVLEDFQHSFKAFIRSLLRFLRCLPRLPAHRRLGMSLTYRDSCPQAYQPPGFVDQEEYPGKIGERICDTLWKSHGDLMGEVQVGNEQIAMSVRPFRIDEPSTSIDPQDMAMSKQLQAMQKTSSQRTTNLVSTLQDSGSRRKRNSDVPLPVKRMKLPYHPGHQERNSQHDFLQQEQIEGTEFSKHDAATIDTHEAGLSPETDQDRDLQPQKTDYRGPNTSTNSKLPGSTRSLRRKISISRNFINIDRSSSVESQGVEQGLESNVGIDDSSDIATTSTATAD
ncbi:hypothetical protein LTS17_010343 [Exophiala oligosperma]